VGTSLEGRQKTCLNAACPTISTPARKNSTNLSLCTESRAENGPRFGPGYGVGLAYQQAKILTPEWRHTLPRLEVAKVGFFATEKRLHRSFEPGTGLPARVFFTQALPVGPSTVVRSRWGGRPCANWWGTASQRARAPPLGKDGRKTPGQVLGIKRVHARSHGGR
jgi:hypothetical protein